MSTLLNAQQTQDWHEAVAAVEQVVANTDHESSSKQPLLALTFDSTVTAWGSQLFEVMNG